MKVVVGVQAALFTLWSEIDSDPVIPSPFDRDARLFVPNNGIESGITVRLWVQFYTVAEFSRRDNMVTAWRRIGAE